MSTTHNTKITEDLKKFAETSPSREVCGFVVFEEEGFKLKKCRNYSPVPEMFEVHPIDFLKAKNDKSLVAIFHTHIVGEPKLSDYDLICCKEIKIPYLVYSLEMNTFNLYYEDNFEVDLGVIKELEGIING